MDQFGVLGDEPQQLGGAAGLCVVERNGQVVGALDGRVGGVVLADADFGPGLGRGGFGEVRRCWYLEGDGFDGEVLGAGKAAAEGDDAGVFEVAGGLFEGTGVAGKGFGGEVI